MVVMVTWRSRNAVQQLMLKRSFVPIVAPFFFFFLVKEQSQRQRWGNRKGWRLGNEEAVRKFRGASQLILQRLAQLLGCTWLNRPRCKQKQMWSRRERLDWNKKKKKKLASWHQQDFESVPGPPRENPGGAGAVRLRVAGWTAVKRGGARLFLFLLYAFIDRKQQG